MTPFDTSFAARAPFEGLLPLAAPRGGVIVSDRDGLGIATVSVRKDTGVAFGQLLREHLGIELKHGSYRSSAGDFALHGVGPGTWLATCERGGNAFAARLAEIVGETASVCDQSDGYAVLRIRGPRARETLCKMVPVDVHPSVFRVDDVSVTVAAHMGATLWRLEDDAQRLPVFELAVFRSLASSFWQTLYASAAEFGIATERSWSVP